MSYRLKSITTIILIASCHPVFAAPVEKAYFQSATISGSTNQIVVQNVPVDNNGVITYDNLVINFTVNPTTGALKLASSSITPAPQIYINGFMAGLYADSQGSTYQVSGPSPISGTNRSAWSISLVKAYDNRSNASFSTSWITGPISGHPDENLLTTDGITSTEYSWGVMGANNFCGSSFTPCGGGPWSTGNVIGASQAGNNLTIHLFQNASGNSRETSNVTLMYCPTPTTCP
jgi:hypothetical protein